MSLTKYIEIILGRVIAKLDASSSIPIDLSIKIKKSFGLKFFFILRIK